MARKRFKREQIIYMHREAEIKLVQWARYAYLSRNQPDHKIQPIGLCLFGCRSHVCRAKVRVKKAKVGL